MPARQLSDVPADPAAARAFFEAESASSPVIVFKKSPICPVSTLAENEFQDFLKTDPDVAYAFVDVIAQKPLARGLTAELDIRHESPQALWFDNGALAWHDSHGSLTEAAFRERLSSPAS